MVLLIIVDNGGKRGEDDEGDETTLVIGDIVGLGVSHRVVVSDSIVVLSHFRAVLV